MFKKIKWSMLVVGIVSMLIGTTAGALVYHINMHGDRVEDENIQKVDAFFDGGPQDEGSFQDRMKRETESFTLMEIERMEKETKAYTDEQLDQYFWEKHAEKIEEMEATTDQTIEEIKAKVDQYIQEKIESANH